MFLFVIFAFVYDDIYVQYVLTTCVIIRQFDVSNYYNICGMFCIFYVGKLVTGIKAPYGIVTCTSLCDYFMR